ncbi:MAG TPA: hypothetical protein LFW11_06415 [Rickettsia endosymbiont of Proechinophthirus fluctus]|nr:hypothetical protein [Rickettsia endosymbiont of Proechinophthirus fluctus]
MDTVVKPWYDIE